MKICVKHQDQRVDFFVDFDQQRKNEKSVVIRTYEKKKGISCLTTKHYLQLEISIII